MKTIEEILSVTKIFKDSVPHYITIARLSDGEEYRGYSSIEDEFQMNDKVEAFWNDRWDYAQMIKPVRSEDGA
jgi:hypothetical protein